MTLRDLMDYEGFVERKESTKNDTLYIRKINENQNTTDLFPDFPVNKPMKFNQALMVKAIQYGMIISIIYQGDRDKWKGGRTRVIYPMNLGINHNTKNLLIRGFHLSGQSLSVNKKNKTPYANTQKVWRLFKADNIKSMMFTGNFYRLPPRGYKMNDRVLSEKTIARADFIQIRKNQEALIKSGKIESEEKVKITEKVTTSTIRIKNSGTVLNLQNPFENEILAKFKKEPWNVKITILKTVFTNDFIAIFGALGEVDRTVRVYEEQKLMGSYKTLASFTGDKFKDNKKVKNITEFDLYIFEKKV